MADVLRLLVAPPPRLREFIAARLRAAASLRPRHAKHGGGGGGVLAVAAAAVEEAAPAAKAGGLAVVLSTAMGYLIVVGAVVSRMPQVWKVWRAKACEGLNPLSHEIEMFGYTVCVLNGLRLGLPPDMWGENMFHSSFGTAMVLMIYGFAKPGSRESVSKTRKTAVLAVYAALCVTGFTGILPSVIIHRLYDVQNIAFFISRLFQISTNIRRGGTGQLQVVTRAALFVGNMMRIFTTITKNGGAPMVVGHASSALVNGFIFFQCIWYWNSKTSN